MIVVCEYRPKQVWGLAQSSTELSLMLYGALCYMTFVVCRITCTIGSCHNHSCLGYRLPAVGFLLNIRHTDGHQRFRESKDYCNT